MDIDYISVQIGTNKQIRINETEISLVIPFSLNDNGEFDAEVLDHIPLPAEMADKATHIALNLERDNNMLISFFDVYWHLTYSETELISLKEVIAIG